MRDRIVKCMSERPIPIDGQPSLMLGLSIGIATLPGDSNDVAGIMAAADADMYRVKQASRAVREPALPSR